MVKKNSTRKRKRPVADTPPIVPALVAPTEPSEHALEPAIVASAARYASAARSDNTRRAYESRWRGFVKWCEESQRSVMPSSSATVAAYITVLADLGRTASTIAQTMVAIAEAHRLANEPNPCADRVVEEVWKGIQRTIGTAPVRPAKPILTVQLGPLVDALPSNLHGIRDRALLLIGFAAAMRRSELVALDVEDIEPTKEGLVIRVGGRDAEGKVRRSKTDQEGKGVSVGIPRGTGSTDPVAALEAWLNESDIESGALFRSVSRWENIGARLSPIDVARAVQNAVRGAGGNSVGYSGHSLRAGLATSAAKAGKSVFAIKRQGRWASSQTLDRYIRESEVFADNAAEGIV